MMASSARVPREIQVLRPLTTQLPSGCLRAVVVMPAVSEPVSGSVKHAAITAGRSTCAAK